MNSNNITAKSGDKFWYAGRTYTIASFYSRNGIEYQTARACAKYNPGKRIDVKILELDGGIPLSAIKLDAK